jgi:hypothetical protein
MALLNNLSHGGRTIHAGNVAKSSCARSGSKQSPFQRLGRLINVRVEGKARGPETPNLSQKILLQINGEIEVRQQISIPAKAILT